MKKRAAIALLSCLAIPGSLLGAEQRLQMKVSPVVALAPAQLTVRAIVEPNDDNRALNIIVSSSSYERTSEISLDGRAAQRVNVFALRDVPTGLYEVRAVLVGASGQIASAMQLIKVQPSPGYSH